MYRLLCEPEFHFSRHPGVRLLGCVVSVCLTSEETPNVFQSGCAILQLLQQQENASCAPSLTNTVQSVLSIGAILSDTKRNLLMVLIGFSLMTNDVEHISHLYNLSGEIQVFGLFLNYY